MAEKEQNKYKTMLLKALKGEVEEIKIEFQVKKAKKSMESAILDLEEKIADFDVKIEQSKYKYPIDFTAMLNMQDERALIERRLNQANALMKELF